MQSVLLTNILSTIANNLENKIWNLYLNTYNPPQNSLQISMVFFSSSTPPLVQCWITKILWGLLQYLKQINARRVSPINNSALLVGGKREGKRGKGIGKLTIIHCHSKMYEVCLKDELSDSIPTEFGKDYRMPIWEFGYFWNKLELILGCKLHLICNCNFIITWKIHLKQ